MTVFEPSLRHNFSWTLTGNVFYAACLWGVLVSLTKLGDLDTVGRFALGSAVANPVVMFSNLQLRGLLATDAGDTYQFKDYWGLRLALAPFALLVIMLIAFLFFDPRQALIIGIFGVIRLLESFSDMTYGVAQKYERMDLMSKSLVLRGGGSFLFFSVAFLLTRNLAWGLWGMVLGMLLPLVLFDLPRCASVLKNAGQGLRPGFDLHAMRSIAWLALPMGLVMLLLQLRQTIPRTVIEHHLGEDALGVFAALSYLVIAGMTVVTAMGQSSLARLSRYYLAGEKERFQRTVWQLMGVGLGLGFAGVALAAFWGGAVLRIIYSAEYAQHDDLFVLIMAAGGIQFISSLLGAPIFAMRAFRGLLVIFSVNVLLILVLSLVLVPDRGLNGAALSVLGGALWTTGAMVALLWWRIRRLSGKSQPSPGGDE